MVYIKREIYALFRIIKPGFQSNYPSQYQKRQMLESKRCTKTGGKSKYYDTFDKIIVS